MRGISNLLRGRYGRLSFSQEGEDMLLARIFEGQDSGFYIDVGAHHPMRFSNTYYFYQRGWRGINIDAAPESKRLFDKYRKRDVNIEVGVGEKEELLEYYLFNEPALNGFSRELSEERNYSDNYHITGVRKIQIKRLDSILETLISSEQSIDFLSIDVEGLDLSVLRSNDWNRFRPKYVLVEALDFDLADYSVNPVYLYLMEKNYQLYGKCVKTVIFKEIP